MFVSTKRCFSSFLEPARKRNLRELLIELDTDQNSQNLGFRPEQRGAGKGRDISDRFVSETATEIGLGFVA